MIAPSQFCSKHPAKACNLDAELLSAVEACVLAIDSRDESELHRQLAIRERLMARLRELLLEDIDTIASLKLLKEASQLEAKMFVRLYAWRDEVGAQLDNLEHHRRLARAYEMD